MIRRSLLAFAIGISSVVAPFAGGGTATAATSPPYPVREVPVVGPPDFFGLTSATSDTDFLLIYSATGQRGRFEVATGRMTPIDFGGFTANLDSYSLSADGRYAYAAVNKQIRRVTVDTGAIVDLTVPFGGDWTIESVADTDAAGRYLLLRANSGNFASLRVFVYDAQNQVLVTPDPTGVEAATNVLPLSISADGQIVRYATYVVGAPFDRVTSWNRTTGARTTIERPTGLDLQAGDWVPSPDLEWVLFAGSSSGIVPGLDATTRLYRRHLATGATTAVPLPFADVVSYGVGNGGRVLATVTTASPGSGSVLQAYTWDGTGPALMITRGSDGTPIAGGIDGLFPIVDDAMTRVLFTSLVTTSVVGDTVTAETRLFEIALPPIGQTNAAAVIRAGERYCVSAVGADPGDFVGVNITPVLATGPGFGTLHSSDDPAGNTSNVNFGPNSVDPNVAFTKVGTDGRICFTNSTLGPVHVILDEMIVADASAFRTPTTTGSTRLMDTRIGLGGPTLQPGESRCVGAIGAQAGEFVGVNVLPINATGPGFGTIHASGSPAGASSTANYTRGSFDPNFAFTKVGPDGGICFTNAPFGTVDLVLDALIVGTSTVMRTPTPGPNSDRPVDTRTGIGGTRLAPGGSVCFGIPGSTAGDVGFVNLLAVDAAGPGFATVHSSADAPGSTSNANYTTGSFDPNMGIASFGPDNKLCVTNGPISATDLIVDSQVIASASAFTKPTPAGTVRLVDTRIARA